MKRFLSLSVLAVVLFLSSMATAAPGPVEIVNQKYDAIRKLVRINKTRADLEKSIRLEMDSFVDYDELGRLALADEWTKLKAPERKKFVDGFKKMIQRSYVKKFNPDTTFDVEIGAVVDEGSKVTVNSTIRSGKSEAGVAYAFHRAGNRWMVYDVIIDDVSMVRNYRKQFHTIIGREGFAGLMAKIDKKNSQQTE